MSNAVTTFPLSARARAMLRAVAEGRAEITASCEPDMFVDGLACCDQALAHTLTRSGLIRRTRFSETAGRHVASLTRLGFEELLKQASARAAQVLEREAS
ncbi:MAG: hypothetical protein ACRDQW_03260 [Haloechinothrix sp.]